MKNLLIFLGVVVVSYGVYQWDQSRNLDNYFADQFSLDWQIQDIKGDWGHNGTIFEQTYAEMKEMGYNPYEIQQIMFKGFDRGTKKIKEQKKAQERIKELQEG